MGFCCAKKFPAPLAPNVVGSPVGKEEGPPPPPRVPTPPPLLRSNACLHRALAQTTRVCCSPSKPSSLPRPFLPLSPNPAFGAPSVFPLGTLILRRAIWVIINEQGKVSPV